MKNEKNNNNNIIFFGPIFASNTTFRLGRVPFCSTTSSHTPQHGDNNIFS